MKVLSRIVPAAGAAMAVAAFAAPAASASTEGHHSSPGAYNTVFVQTVDAASTPYGEFLYVQAGGPGAVDEFAVGHGGSLTKIGSVTVAGAAGGEGIVAS